MHVRRAAAGDLAAIEELYRAFFAERPQRDHDDTDLDRELVEVREIVASQHAFVAEVDGLPVGFVLACRRTASVVEITDLYVSPDARSTGVATALVREALSALDGETRYVKLRTEATNGVARSVYQHWGFREDIITLLAPVEGLRERLTPGQHAVSFASIHVQTDDVVAVERAVAAFAPRIGSKRSNVEGPRNGWLAIYDEVADRDPTTLVRFAREVSSRLGAVVIALSLEVDQVVRLVALDRGGIVDEYLSVPEFYGPLPPGDVIGLAANPTVLQRLTGASPDAVRAAARTASSTAELPPPRELLASLASALGLEGVDHGYQAE
jgi:ribosomal protein S18 acetylase RimI-like enzyme